MFLKIIDLTTLSTVYVFFSFAKKKEELVVGKVLFGSLLEQRFDKTLEKPPFLPGRNDQQKVCLHNLQIR